MANKPFEVGEKAVIVVTEHPTVNLGRVVTLTETRGYLKTGGYVSHNQLWIVEDGHTFEGFVHHQDALGNGTYCPDPSARQTTTALGIVAWKLRRLNPDENMIEVDGITYAEAERVRVYGE